MNSITRNNVYYYQLDDKLRADLLRAKDLCFRFNHTIPSEVETREEILSDLLPHKGEGVTITAPFYCDYGYNLYLGDDAFINYDAVILDCAKVRIGNRVLIAPHCTISAAEHPINKDERKHIQVSKEISIEDDVWIGAGVTIIAGVHIGEGSIIGAGSVVTRAIPAGVIAFGNPCKVHRQITDKDRLNLGEL